ncbi:hypothetical protein ACHWQZ_G015702 [Mnemiopsis leidyi]
MSTYGPYTHPATLDRNLRIDDRTKAKDLPPTLPHHTWQIFTDGSKLGSTTGAGYTVKSRLILETINGLNKLGETNQVSISIHWIPGQEGVPGNERADELARQGSNVRPIGPEPFVPLPSSHITGEIHKSLIRSHLKEYTSNKLSNKGKTPLLHYLKENGYRTLNNSGTNLRWLTWLFRGHSPLNCFQHKTGNATTLICATCDRGKPQNTSYANALDT